MHAGLISAAPGKKTSALHVASQQVERMVQQKMQTPEYIILCLEDSSDWSNATTRRLVMSVRPQLFDQKAVRNMLDAARTRACTTLFWSHQAFTSYLAAAQ